MSITTNPLISGVPTGSGDAPVGYTVVSGATHTWAAGEKLYCTNASGCTVTLPSGIAEGEAGLAIQATGAGAITIATSSSTTIPTGTLATNSVGQIIGWERTETADEYVVNGYTPSGPRYLGTYTDWDSVVADYPVSGAAIAALGAADYLMCPIRGRMTTFRPNSAKTRLIADTGRIPLVLLGGTTANPIVAGRNATGLFSLPGGTPQLPAYLAQAGDFFEVEILVRHTGTAAGSETQLKIGTANSSSDQTIAKITTSSANNQDGYATQSAYIRTTTEVGATQATLPNSSSSATQNTPSPLAFNSLQYINLYLATITSPDTIVPTQLKVTLVQAA